jgi:hypothetical protein
MGAMHRWVPFLIAASVAAAACDDNGATSPSGLPVILTAFLNPANEVPPVSNEEARGTGAAQFTLHVTRDSAGAITGGTLDMYFQASSFPDGTTVVGAHIHPGVAGANGPVLIGTRLNAQSPLVLTGGRGEYTETGVAVNAANATALINNPAGFYFNIHSPRNAGGFARGQLTRTQ